MKPKAIISLLWGAQFEVVRQFLMMHEPMVLIAPAGSLNLEMCALVTQLGGHVVWLDDFSTTLSDDNESQILTRIEHDFGTYLQSQESIAGLPQQGSAERLTSIILGRLNVDMPKSLAMLRSLARAAEQFDIALLVTSEDMMCQGKVVTAWAKARGIPSLHLAHAIALLDPFTVLNRLLADKLAVYGKRGLEGYLDLGIADERLVVTGNPAWDNYSVLRKRKAECREQLNEKYALNPKRPLVVFGTTWSSNLSAMCNANIFTESVQAFLYAIKELRARGIEVNAVVKDRAANVATGEESCRQLREAIDLGDEHYCYAVDDTQLFAAAADVLVAVDSNYLVEAMLAETPAVNLMNATGQLMGPCFEAESGILEVEFEGLADGVHLLLTDQPTRSTLLGMASKRASYYNHGHGEGRAAIRVAETLAGMTTKLRRRGEQFVWQEYLNVAAADVKPEYNQAGRPDLAAMYSNSPKLILDIGCAAGGTSALLKQRFPNSRAWGIEMNHASAELAAQKLDRVLVGKFEDFDLEEAGIQKGSLDAVLLADVLEHMYDPWDVMVKLRPFMSSTGQLLLSIPNVRNLLLMDELSKGNFSYTGSGLLDITHIRFFTLKEILRFCSETGYRVIARQNAIDLRLTEFFKQHQTQTLSDINMDRLTLRNVTREELIEVCTLQFHVLLERDEVVA